MIYITGDTHRDFSRLFGVDSSEEDMLIVLGDAGIDYYLNEEDNNFKEYLKRFKLKLFCIRGNHEERPEKFYNNELLQSIKDCTSKEKFTLVSQDDKL